MVSRRRFLAHTVGLAAAAGGGFPRPALAQARPRVVVVGGGAGGASVVRRLAQDHGQALDVTLVEPRASFMTCYYSNLYLGGVQPLEVIQQDLQRIARLPGVTFAADRVASIDRQGRRVTLVGGSVLAYDRLVLSPGIDLDYTSVPGWSREAEQRMPHAWKAGRQTELLRRQLEAVPDGGLIVVIAPPNPYRCPPGPYERVSMMAHQLVSTGRTQARIVVLDPKDSFSKQPLFQQGWEKHYPGMIEWLPPMIHVGIERVDPESLTVETGFESYRADLVNVIPRQTAGQIALDAGLAADNGFCPIDPFTMKARDDEAIFVLGDASNGGDMPKSAFAANSQAQVVAQVLARELLGVAQPEVAYRNRCWSLIAENDSVWVGGRYRPTPNKIEQAVGEVSGLEDTADLRRRNYEDSVGWYVGLTTRLYS